MPFPGLVEILKTMSHHILGDCGHIGPMSQCYLFAILQGIDRFGPMFAEWMAWW